MASEFNPRAGDPEKSYERIAHQFEREDNLHQTRVTTCVVLNLGLSAAVAAQVSGDMNIKTYVIVIGCCVIGYLITRGIRFATNAGEIQKEYLRKCFGKLDDEFKGRFVWPTLHEPTGNSRAMVKFTEIAKVFEIIWIVTFLLVTFSFFYQTLT